ncbi:Ger(x)C family spore germination protein [Paenibacillus doosanensis]|uniref:Spore germination protein B3 n=1 Tax=Paenibacillus konkukensis TaxID=2020716 RepID=A0ABY4RTD8_9BACL|nr:MULTISPECIES: Ger(x)C family spore germination protein [Paenibacillus]MCS7464709.1 Ger(x)C family spore germination protein [Paenibacillus doosanensis]UQZ85851.1 Spore germination protein B3 precursor [Paenibacillus konkukensis]
MKRLAAAALASILLLSLTTGCWNRRELNTLGIQLGTAIDKKGDQVQVAVQVVEPSAIAAKVGSNDLAPVVMYKATAPTVFQAFRKMTEVSPRKVYAAHIRVLVLSEELAKDGVGKALDLLFRDSESRTDFYVMVAKESKAEDVLKILTPLEKIPANKLYNSLETSSKAWAPTTTFTLDQFIEQLVSEGMNPVLTGIVVKGNRQLGETKRNVEQIEPEARLEYSTLAVFKKDKLIGWLDEEESRGYNYIMNNVKSTVGSVRCPDGGKIDLESIRAQSTIKGSVVNGEPVIDISVKGESNIGNVECKIDIENPETMQMLQREAEQALVKRMKQTVKVAQSKYKVDMFGFGQAIYRSNPQEWKKLKDNWTERFPKVKVNYKAKVLLRKLGTTGNSFLNDVKE